MRPLYNHFWGSKKLIEPNRFFKIRSGKYFSELIPIFASMGLYNMVYIISIYSLYIDQNRSNFEKQFGWTNFWHPGECWYRGHIVRKQIRRLFLRFLLPWRQLKKFLMFVWIKIGIIEDDIVVYRGHGALTNFLWNQQEIEHITTGNFWIDNCSRIWIIFIAVLIIFLEKVKFYRIYLICTEETLIDSFLEDGIR